MTKFLTLSTHIGFILIIIMCLSTMKVSRAAPSKNLQERDMNADDDDIDVDEQRRIYDIKKLRHFLLTSNAEQRAAKREQQEYIKRQLIREYLQSISDPDPERFQEVKKRFCASFDEFYATQAACLG